jgi:hypothetical protein
LQQSLEVVEGLEPSSRRMVLFYACAPFDDGIAAFRRLLQRGRAAALVKAMDYWVKGIDTQPKRHHGWNAGQHGGQYVRCHVFKHDQVRLYGYKLNPWSQDKSRELCVLGHIPSSKKSQHEVDPRDLDQVVRLGQDDRVAEAVQAYLGKFGWAYPPIR